MFTFVQKLDKQDWLLVLVALWSVWFLVDPLGYVAAWEYFQSQCQASGPHNFGDYAFMLQPCGTWVSIALTHLGVMLFAIVVWFVYPLSVN